MDIKTWLNSIAVIEIDTGITIPETTETTEIQEILTHSQFYVNKIGVKLLLY
jgi:hypothetical protein